MDVNFPKIFHETFKPQRSVHVEGKASWSYQQFLIHCFLYILICVVLLSGEIDVRRKKKGKKEMIIMNIQAKRISFTYNK